MPETIVRVTLPEMGESVTEGSIVEWRVKPGQWIEEGGTLVDVTTDKVDVEVPAPAAGLVTSVTGGEGDTVAVGGLLAEIDTSAAKPDGDAVAPAHGNGAKVATSAVEPHPPVPASYGAAGGSGNDISVPADAKAGGRASHRAQRIAEREHLDLRTIVGTGPDGLILQEDVIRAAATWSEHAAKGNGSATNGHANGAAPSAPIVIPLPATSKAVAIKGPANALANAMEQSLTIPTATSFRTLQVGTLELRRTELNAALKAAGRSEKISFTHLIAFALVRAAHEQPAMMASFRREGATAQRVENGVHLGIAVDTERKDGSRFLVVPVIKGADGLDFIRFRSAYEALIAKAREGKLGADDLTGASFTLTNPGGIGTIASVPRLMAGQSAIIAAGAIAYPPGFLSADLGALKALGVEKVMTITSTYDHRVVQGAQSGEYLRRVDELLAHEATREDQIVDVLHAGPASAAGVAERLPWTRRNKPFADLGEFHQQFAVAETLAHLEHLRAESRAGRHDDGGYRYTLTA